MEKSERFNQVVALGRKLVKELDLEPSVDTLGRWMAHYIADLMKTVEESVGDAREVAEKKCFESILSLWKHRYELPNGERPFEELEPIVRAIGSLDPDNDTPRYFRAVMSSKEETDESKVGKWLTLIEGIDYSAKILIRYFLAEAARDAVNKTKEWVELANAAGAESDISETVIRFVSNEADLGAAPILEEEAQRTLQDRIKRLDGFLKMVEIVNQDLKAKLLTLTSKSDTKGTDV
jgi:hypothetical protein